ncbi:C2H2 finger domain-containing protein [Histoplasma capsulatum]|uniref:C2H2 finger domain-containing protein n=1 Tax=Ajellomyces capsulatus TaxID=5037 RepID=A0A8A1MIT7_AJECA|nr:C2H2 finger domain-containing protein [Histoplasma capsulatum]
MSFNPRQHQRAVSDTEPITYTPKTGKPSRGLKGKRVHFCEFPGCGKRFSRAEHVRGDKVDAYSENARIDAHIRSSPETIASEPQGLLPSIPLNQQHTSMPTVSQEANLMSIGSLVQPGTEHPFANDYSMPVWCEPERDLVRGDLFSDSPQVNTDDTMVYSSPDSCQSPASDVNPFRFPQRTPIMDQSYSESFYHPQTHGSPYKMTSTASDWTPPQERISSLQMLPISLEGDALQTVALPVPIPFTRVDGNEWHALQHELDSSPSVAFRNGGMEVIDTTQWQDCLECYWKCFHPLFPIVHRPTFSAVKPFPLISGAMVAIGSQYDTRPNAKEYSLFLLEACLKLLTKFIQNRHWTSKNPLAVFNTLSEDDKLAGLEKAYSFWVENETRRRILQASFLLDVQQSTLFQQPLVFLQANLRTPRSNVGNVEPIDLPFPCQTELWEIEGIEEWAQHARAYAKSQEKLTLSSVARRIIHQNDDTLKLDPFQSNLILSYALLTNMRSMDLELALEPFIERVKQEKTERESMQGPGYSISSTHPSHTLFTYHFLLAAYRAPLKALLIVSGESWLFNQKLADKEEYQQAKNTLRMWVSGTDELKKAVWHALRALQYAIDHLELGDAPVLINANPNLSRVSDLFSDGNGCLTPLDAFTQFRGNIHPTENAVTTPEYLVEGSATLPHLNRSGAVTALHANWALYICALICWAYGAKTPTTTTTDDPLFRPPACPRTYVSTLMLLAPSWSQISHNSIPDHIRRDTSELLKYVRDRWLQPDSMGGLLNEGARVLQRLSENHHRYEDKAWEF